MLLEKASLLACFSAVIIGFLASFFYIISQRLDTFSLLLSLTNTQTPRAVYVYAYIIIKLFMLHLMVGMESYASTVTTSRREKRHTGPCSNIGLFVQLRVFKPGMYSGPSSSYKDWLVFVNLNHCDFL